MIDIMTTTATAQQPASATPMRPRTSVPSASAFHGVQAQGEVSAVARLLPLDTTGVSIYCGTTDVVVKGAFPGTSAWSPPI